MAIKRVVPLNQITGVAAGGTAFINLTVGARRYHNIFLGLKLGNAGGATEANMAAQVSEIRVNIDSVTQRRATPQQIFDLNRQKGKSPTVATGTTVPGWITLMFAEPQRKGIVEREAGAWGMDGVGSFQIEVDIAATATTPTLYGFAMIDDLTEAPMGITKWKREGIQIAATGIVTYKLDTNKGEAYSGVTFIETTAGDIGGLELTLDGLQVYKDDENFAPELLNISDYTKVAKYRHAPLSYNAIGNNLPTVKGLDANGRPVKYGEFIASLNMDVAANVVCIREVVGSPD